MKPEIPGVLRERRGHDVAHAFNDYIEDYGEKWRRDVTTTDTERMDYRMKGLASREDLTEGVARIAQEMSNIRVELLRWSFVFWIGQVAATAGLMALLIRMLQP